MTTTTATDAARQRADETRDALPAELACTVIDGVLRRDDGAEVTAPLVAFTSPAFPGLAVTCDPSEARTDGVVRWGITHVPTGRWLRPTLLELAEALALAAAIGHLTDWSALTLDNRDELLPPVVARWRDLRLEDNVDRLFGHYSCDDCQARSFSDDD